MLFILFNNYLFPELITVWPCLQMVLTSVWGDSYSFQWQSLDWCQNFCINTRCKQGHCYTVQLNTLNGSTTKFLSNHSCHLWFVNSERWLWIICQKFILTCCITCHEPSAYWLLKRTNLFSVTTTLPLHHYLSFIHRMVPGALGKACVSVKK